MEVLCGGQFQKTGHLGKVHFSLGWNHWLSPRPFFQSSLWVGKGNDSQINPAPHLTHSVEHQWPWEPLPYGHVWVDSATLNFPLSSDPKCLRKKSNRAVGNPGALSEHREEGLKEREQQGWMEARSQSPGWKCHTRRGTQGGPLEHKWTKKK